MLAKKTWLAIVCLGLLFGSAAYYLNPMIASAVSLAARQACSLYFSAGLPVNLARETYINGHVRPVGPYLDIEFNGIDRTVQASLFGLYTAHAAYFEGNGCVLDHGQPIVQINTRVKNSIQHVPINRETRSAKFDTDALAAALEAAFREPHESAPRQTMAVLVLSEGELVAEKYAADVQQSTRLPGYSMAKSMTATMIGLLVMHKQLDVNWVVEDAGELTQAGVTYDQLLRMTSGVGVVEDGSGRDGNSIMLTQTHDAARYAINQDLMSVPGTTYAYSGANSVVLANRFVDIAGNGDPSKAYAFLAANLLTPMGLNSVVLETDGVGTFLGSSFMLATALDWAKLGQLYLQDGIWQGRRLLPPGWRKYVSTKTPQSAGKDYGAGFWVAVQGGRDAQHAHLPKPPVDAFFMHGMMNQAVYILPSPNLVVVRLGATRSYLHAGEWELLRDVIAAQEVKQ